MCARTRACVWVCVRSHATTDNDASYISAVGYLLVATVCLGECSVCVKFVQCWVSVKFVCCWPPAPVFNPKNPNNKKTKNKQKKKNKKIARALTRVAGLAGC